MTDGTLLTCWNDVRPGDARVHEITLKTKGKTHIIGVLRKEEDEHGPGGMKVQKMSIPAGTEEEFDPFKKIIPVLNFENESFYIQLKIKLNVISPFMDVTFYSPVERREEKSRLTDIKQDVITTHPYKIKIIEKEDETPSSLVLKLPAEEVLNSRQIWINFRRKSSSLFRINPSSPCKIFIQWERAIKEVSSPVLFTIFLSGDKESLQNEIVLKRKSEKSVNIPCDHKRYKYKVGCLFYPLTGKVNMEFLCEFF